MRNSRKIVRIAAAFVVAMSGAALGAHPAAADPQGDQRLRVTRFLGEQRLPHRMMFNGTTVGGISGLDRDPRTGTWYLISDDRWRYNPARFYTGSLNFNRESGAFTGVSLTGVTTLKRADGSPYPGYGLPESADPETIRFDPWTRRLLWGHEGDRPDDRNPNIPISDLFVRWAGTDGRHLGELPIPANLKMTDTTSGPRRNFGFEGLTFAPRTIAAVVEGPRYEDGEPSTVEHGAPARITVWSRGGRPIGQYVYPVDPLPAAPVPPTGWTDTGVSEILAIDDSRYLALERSWLEGVGYRVRLYEIDRSHATNVIGRDRLAGDLQYRPVSKRLVLDLGTRQEPEQNLEGLAWGPKLRTGECTLVLAADDNFDPGEVGQFLAYGVRGCPASR
ncbi:esterase-like activity of phytase family protein [Nonomuraea sp. NBC_01738]|uniref:esterase-like activity of phytase family protein n=1 Tax=Nonomuraea sp. NBC_01738 TaxID=2976003 RepID=UPI002E0DDDCA|nr:esterase-like activity of phytase family protein [Nonomuraea sp. NBC_01738]